MAIRKTNRFKTSAFSGYWMDYYNRKKAKWRYHKEIRNASKMEIRKEMMED